MKMKINHEVLHYYINVNNVILYSAKWDHFIYTFSYQIWWKQNRPKNIANILCKEIHKSFEKKWALKPKTYSDAYIKNIPIS